MIETATIETALIDAPEQVQRLGKTDLLLLAGFCLLLFGFTLFDGRPLSLHSARLPETAREMMNSHDWLVPRSGGRPWLERPPLPHWIMIGFAEALGQQIDHVWIARLPSAFMGAVTVLLTAWIGSAQLGRTIGLLGGYALATAFEFYSYSTLSEDDIYLAAVVAAAMAIFVHIEKRPPTQLNPIGWRPWPVLLFFFVIGLTNWVKSPLVGMAAFLPAIGVFLIWEKRWLSIKRYLWLWGILVCLLLTVLYPYLMIRQFPATIHNWSFDYVETEQYDQPFWYYPLVMPGLFMPWAPAAIVGLWIAWTSKAVGRRSAYRFVLCWAIVPVLVFTLPHRKHHHYLVPSLAPWGILAGIGLDGIGAWIIERQRATAKHLQTCFAVTLAILLVGYSVGQLAISDTTGNDTPFLISANHMLPPDALLTINSDLGGEMDFFRNQFYVRSSAVLLHNLTFLRDERLQRPTVYVITRASDESKLREFGDISIVLQSTKTRREKSPADRFTLFQLTFDPNLKRYPAPPPDSITTKQAMDREPGPWCGPPL